VLFLDGFEFQSAIVLVVWIGIDTLLGGMTQTARKMVVVSLFGRKGMKTCYTRNICFCVSIGATRGGTCLVSMRNVLSCRLRVVCRSVNAAADVIASVKRLRHSADPVIKKGTCS